MTMIHQSCFRVAVAERFRVKMELQKFHWLPVVSFIALGFLCMDATRADDLPSQIPNKLSFDGFDIASGQDRVAQVLGEMWSQGKKESEWKFQF